MPDASARSATEAAEANRKATGRHQLTKAVASLANTEGGLVAIGVAEAEEEKGWSAADHVEPAPAGWSRDRMLQFLNDNISPPIPKLDLTAERTAGGGTLLLIHVPVSYLGHQNRRKDGEGGEYRTRRANGVSEPLDGRDVRQLLMRTQGKRRWNPIRGARDGADGRAPTRRRARSKTRFWT